MSVHNFRDQPGNGCYDINASILMCTTLQQCFGLCPAPYDAKHFLDRFILCLAAPFLLKWNLQLADLNHKIACRVCSLRPLILILQVSLQNIGCFLACARFTLAQK